MCNFLTHYRRFSNLAKENAKTSNSPPSGETIAQLIAIKTQQVTPRRSSRSMFGRRINPNSKKEEQEKREKKKHLKGKIPIYAHKLFIYSFLEHKKFLHKEEIWI